MYHWDYCKVDVPTCICVTNVMGSTTDLKSSYHYVVLAHAGVVS